MGQYGHYVKRSTMIPMPKFVNLIARPIMRQVAAGHLKKNLGLAVAAVCGGVHFLPHQTYYSGTTNSLQTLSSHLSHYKCQPNHLEPDPRPIEEVEIPVFPMFNKENDVPDIIIKRLVDLCDKYNIDHNLFTKTGGMIRLTKNFLQVVAYFATDKGLDKEQHIWGTKKPLSHIPHHLLDPQDIPQRLIKKTNGEKRGRPRKIHTNVA